MQIRSTPSPASSPSHSTTSSSSNHVWKTSSSYLPIAVFIAILLLVPPDFFFSSTSSSTSSSSGGGLRTTTTTTTTPLFSPGGEMKGSKEQELAPGFHICNSPVVLQKAIAAVTYATELRGSLLWAGTGTPFDIASYHVIHPCVRNPFREESWYFPHERDVIVQAQEVVLEGAAGSSGGGATTTATTTTTTERKAVYEGIGYIVLTSTASKDRLHAQIDTWGKRIDLATMFRAYADYDDPSAYTYTMPELEMKSSYEEAQHRVTRGLKHSLDSSPDFAVADFIMILGDDCFVNVPELHVFTGTWNPDVPAIFGWMWVREDRCFAAGGSGILMTRAAAQLLAENLYTDACPHVGYDDLTIGYCAWLLRIPQIHSPLFDASGEMFRWVEAESYAYTTSLLSMLTLHRATPERMAVLEELYTGQLKPLPAVAVASSLDGEDRVKKDQDGHVVIDDEHIEGGARFPPIP